jgi:hypothetical protein
MDVWNIYDYITTSEGAGLPDTSIWKMLTSLKNVSIYCCIVNKINFFDFFYIGLFYFRNENCERGVDTNKSWNIKV